ncbi:hypothetical protein [Thermaurantiacus sp.]
MPGAPEARRALACALDSRARAVVIRNTAGILAEGHRPTGGPEQSEPLASGSKSFLSALVVLAEAGGLLRIDQPAAFHLPPICHGGGRAGSSRIPTPGPATGSTVSSR